MTTGHNRRKNTLFFLAWFMQQKRMENSVHSTYNKKDYKRTAKRYIRDNLNNEIYLHCTYIKMNFHLLYLWENAMLNFEEKRRKITFVLQMRKRNLNNEIYLHCTYIKINSHPFYLWENALLNFEEKRRKITLYICISKWIFICYTYEKNALLNFEEKRRKKGGKK